MGLRLGDKSLLKIDTFRFHNNHKKALELGLSISEFAFVMLSESNFDLSHQIGIGIVWREVDVFHCCASRRIFRTIRYYNWGGGQFGAWKLELVKS